MANAVPITVSARGPVSEIGVISQLRRRPEVTFAEPGMPAAVILAIVDSVDEEPLSLLRALHAGEALPIVLIVSRIDPRALLTLAETGVRGVLSRAEATAEGLVRAIQSAAAGHGDLPPEVVRLVLDHARQRNLNPLRPGGLPLTGLTVRERHVLTLVADGLSTREVATHLSYSERTIKSVIQDVVLRLNARNRTQAVACAVRNGWI